MLRFQTAGESHGQGLVAILSGLPAGLRVDFAYVDGELKRRQGGYGRGGRMKIESDTAQFLSGVRHGATIGSPITILIENRDWRNWQEAMAVDDRPESRAMYRRLSAPRPGHADLAGCLKFNFCDARYVLERASARETTARVAVGALAKLFLKEFGIEVASHVVSVGSVSPRGGPVRRRNSVRASSGAAGQGRDSAELCRCRGGSAHEARSGPGHRGARHGGRGF